MQGIQPTFQGKISSEGKLDIINKNDFAFYLASLTGKDVEVIVRRKIKTRTNQQNKSLHLWFTLLANALNEAGYDIKKVIRKEVDISWSAYTIKEYLWRPLMKALTGKKSTTQLKTDEVDKIFDEINRVIGERTGVYVTFPSVENMILEN